MDYEVFKKGRLPKAGGSARWYLFCDGPVREGAPARIDQALRGPVGAVVPRDLALAWPAWHDEETMDIRFAAPNALAVTRAAYEAVGGIDRTQSDAAWTDLVRRLRKAGYGVFYLPDAEVGFAELPAARLAARHIPFAEKLRQLHMKVRRRWLRDAARHQRYYNDRVTSGAVMAGLLYTIEEAKKAGRPTVAVLAPCPGDDTLSQSEGYMRRVAAVDKEVLGGCLRIYLYESPYQAVDVLRVSQPDGAHIYVRYNNNYRYHRLCVLALISACGALYSHSVLRLIPVNGPEKSERYLDIFADKTVRHFFDAHGVVPEESAYLGLPERAAYENRAEALYVAHADTVITLTAAMNRHFSEKYGEIQGEMVRLPVFNADIEPAAPLTEKPMPTGKPVAVYAGGIQPWQNIPLIQQAMRRRGGDVVFSMCVTDPAAFMESWGEGTLPPGAAVETRAPAQLAAEYEKAHYGFILRDDTVLNRVACPTKLVEYLKFGIVPILLSAAIGDFAEMGLRYVTLADFLSAGLPAARERDAMARDNYRLLEELQRQYEAARVYLKTRVEDAAKQSGP